MIVVLYHILDFNLNFGYMDTKNIFYYNFEKCSVKVLFQFMLILCKLFIAHFILSLFYDCKSSKVNIFNEEKLGKRKCLKLEEIKRFFLQG